jgi:hypothetical protein
MSCIRHRSLVVLVVFVLLSALLLSPGAAHARLLGMDRPSAAGVLGTLGEWLRELFERAGWGMDPNGGATQGSAAIGTDAGWGMDPNGLL